MGSVESTGSSGVGKNELVSKPVKILYTIPNFITAGSGGAMLNIIKRLDKDKFSPAVAVLKKGGKLDAEVEQLGIPFIETQFTLEPKPYLTLLPRARSAGMIFRPYHFDLWHSFHYADDYTEALVARLSGTRHWIYTKKNMNWHHRSWTVRTLLASRVAAQNTDMMGDFFKTGGFARKTRLIPRGVDTTRFSPKAKPAIKLREKFSIASETAIITCVAQLVPVKDHPSLLQAFARVPAAHLFLAGSTTDKAYQELLLTLSAALGVSDRVHFLGNVSDIPALLAESDVFVLPTMGSGRMEGCPVALLEAMACGKACIATAISGSRDLIIPDESGVLVPPSDPDQLARAINTLIDSPELRQQYGLAARKRVQEHFSIEQEVRLHEEMYTELLGWNA